MNQPQFKQPSLILPGKQLEISKTGLLADYFPAKQFSLNLDSQKLIDFSGKSNHGDHGNMVTADSGDPTQEANDLFYNSDDFTTIPIGVLNSVEGTFEVVFNAVDSYGGLRIIGSDHTAGTNSEVRSFVAANNQFGMTLFNGTASKTGRVLLSYGINLIYTCTWKYNGNVTTVSAYLNGIIQSVDTLAGQVVVPNTSLWIGKWNANYSKFRLFRSLFYNRQLNKYEVQQNYDGNKEDFKKYKVVL